MSEVWGGRAKRRSRGEIGEQDRVARSLGGPECGKWITKTDAAWLHMEGRADDAPRKTHMRPREVPRWVGIIAVFTHRFALALLQQGRRPETLNRGPASLF